MILIYIYIYIYMYMYMASNLYLLISLISLWSPFSSCFMLLLSQMVVMYLLTSRMGLVAYVMMLVLGKNGPVWSVMKSIKSLWKDVWSVPRTVFNFLSMMLF